MNYQDFREFGVFDADDEGMVTIEDKAGGLLIIETPLERENFGSDNEYCVALWNYIHREEI